MGFMSIFNKGNERLMKGLNYDSFTTIARSAEDNARSGGAIGDRKIRLTKDGKGLATTTFNGTEGDRVGQIANARKAFLDATSRPSTRRSTPTRGRSARTVSSPRSATCSSARSRTPWSPSPRNCPARGSRWIP